VLLSTPHDTKIIDINAIHNTAIAIFMNLLNFNFLTNFKLIKPPFWVWLHTYL
jgi:hypothetical protein